MIIINGATIDDEAIAREVQHHPASTREDAERLAGIALALRQLLLQRAGQLEIAGADEEQRIANLIELEVRVPEPNAEEVARYYRRNGLKFMTPALYEAAHIFFPAHPDDEEARSLASKKAEAVLDQVLREPERFGELARLHSACESKKQDGRLGQITKGDTNPEFERTLATMDVGVIAPQPVASRHGYHLVRLDQRVPARQVPLEQAAAGIATHLQAVSKRRATAQYLQLLAAGAKVSGVELAAADCPLVQ